MRWLQKVRLSQRSSFKGCYAIFCISCTKLKKVVLSSSIKELQSGIFSDCTILEEVTLPDNLKIQIRSVAGNNFQLQRFLFCIPLSNYKINTSTYFVIF